MRKILGDWKGRYMSSKKTLVSMLVAVGVLTLSAPLTVMAQATTSARITTLGEEIAILRMEERKAELEAKISGIKKDIKKGPSDAPAFPNAMPGGAPAATSFGVPAEPTVVGISILGKSAQASLRFPNGGRKDVAAGDSIEGGYKVTKITASGVELSKGGKVLWLAPSSY